MSGDVEDKGKQESKITDHFKVGHGIQLFTDLINI